jgi:hypothetical protein
MDSDKRAMKLVTDVLDSWQRWLNDDEDFGRSFKALVGAMNELSLYMGSGNDDEG